MEYKRLFMALPLLFFAVSLIIAMFNGVWVFSWLNIIMLLSMCITIIMALLWMFAKTSNDYGDNDYQ